MDTAVKIRRHLTPPSGIRALGTNDVRREIRREASERVMLRGAGGTYEGWTLNVSRGGVRVIVERDIILGELLDVIVGVANSSPLARKGRVVWFQEESDGFIVGIAFVANQSVEQAVAQ